MTNVFLFADVVEVQEFIYIHNIYSYSHTYKNETLIFYSQMETDNHQQQFFVIETKMLNSKKCQ